MRNKEHYLKKELYNLIQSDISIFEFIQEDSLDGLWYWDLENPKNEWMDEKFWKVLGYDSKDKKHLVSEWQDIIFQEDLEVSINNFNKHIKDKNHSYDQIVRYKHKNDSTVWIRCRGSAIRDKNGKAIRMIGVHTDITSTMTMLKKSNEMLDLKLTNNTIEEKYKCEQTIRIEIEKTKEKLKDM